MRILDVGIVPDDDDGMIMPSYKLEIIFGLGDKFAGSKNSIRFLTDDSYDLDDCIRFRSWIKQEKPVDKNTAPLTEKGHKLLAKIKKRNKK